MLEKKQVQYVVDHAVSIGTHAIREKENGKSSNGIVPVKGHSSFEQLHNCG